jgi:hypothetical protein
MELDYDVNGEWSFDPTSTITTEEEERWYAFHNSNTRNTGV